MQTGRRGDARNGCNLECEDPDPSTQRRRLFCPSPYRAPPPAPQSTRRLALLRPCIPSPSPARTCIRHLAPHQQRARKLHHCRDRARPLEGEGARADAGGKRIRHVVGTNTPCLYREKERGAGAG